jgi:hypothetical protein
MHRLQRDDAFSLGLYTERLQLLQVESAQAWPKSPPFSHEGFVVMLSNVPGET